MFTGATISLEALIGDRPEITLVRDCDLSHVAKIPCLVARRVVPCARGSHLSAALREPDVVGVIVPEVLREQVPEQLGLAVAPNPTVAANSLHEALCAKEGFLWEHFDSVIDPTAIVHPTAYVAPYDVRIGPHTIVHPGAVILERSIIGAHCAIGPGTVVSTDAFEVDTGTSPRRILKQAGGVWLDDYVEVQAKCTLVRSTFGGFTRIGRESKFDCQVHLAHDCQIEERVRIAACAEISGRVCVGADSFIGPNCSISNGVNIGAHAHVTLGAVVVRDVGEGARVSGNFAVDHQRLIAHIKAIR